ncbi:GNAT family N-acetyltransferase [Actinoplanes sp. N902-109]|uniref:GNAT family N-acetyltransferase n=1 Tax=Actinoplanes sp. (strain N902-109) TaxID=649831 RepID=UPI00032941E5|nr:GNAT family N-acetyltransferase [Actinoplanes sp. N902-109]AGL17106.1 GCN5-related N-acetyltransferase [Actinoplanes sp. N902-109]
MQISTELAERAEAEAMFALVSGASAEAADRLGMAAARIGGGIATSVHADETRFWSKVLGLGLDQPVTAAVLDEAVSFSIAQGSPSTTFQTAPALLPPDWAALCETYGITAGSSWVKLVRPAAGFEPARTALRVEQVTDAQAERAAGVLAAGFGMSADVVRSLYVPALRRGDFQAFAAWHDDVMVAAAGVRIDGSTASMYGAATLPEFRGRGAQSALLAARAQLADHHGCQWLIAETGLPDEPGGNPSLNNMTRAGFEVLYERRNYLWRAPTGKVK